MNKEGMVVAIMYQPGNKPCTKPFGTSEKYTLFNKGLPELQKLPNIVVSTVGDNLDVLEARAKQRDRLNSKAFGEDTELTNKEPVKWYIKDDSIKMQTMDGGVIPENPLQATLAFIAERNWCHCIRQEADYLDIMYLISEDGKYRYDNSTIYTYTIGYHKAPTSLPKMLTDIDAVMRTFDRYLEMRKVEHISFV